MTDKLSVMSLVPFHTYLLQLFFTILQMISSVILKTLACLRYMRQQSIWSHYKPVMLNFQN